MVASYAKRSSAVTGYAKESLYSGANGGAA
jgi:hypothetical protein